MGGNPKEQRSARRVRLLRGGRTCLPLPLWRLKPLVGRPSQVFGLLLSCLVANAVAGSVASFAATPPGKPPGWADRHPPLEMLEARSDDLTALVTVEPSRLRAWVKGHLRIFDRLLARAGLDLDRLVEQARQAEPDFSTGLGGPLVPAAAGRLPAPLASAPGVARDLVRLQQVQLLLRSVPLAAPMTDYKINSRFGYRRDPMRRRAAMHTGIDFGGPRNAPVLATAPGEVVEAGRSGAYGTMVVVDHGMGLRTCYAHLAKVAVRVGDRVEAGQRVGTMGRTGRATGPHLHYEIRLDDRPLDPAHLLEAGGQLRQLVGR
jgi:murein DD-endopeptidase MepM/ murein hydrolase activator NlpD